MGLGGWWNREALQLQVLLEAEFQRLHLGSCLFNKDLGFWFCFVFVVLLFFFFVLSEGLAITAEEQNHEVDRSSSTYSCCIRELSVGAGG